LTKAPPAPALVAEKLDIERAYQKGARNSVTSTEHPLSDEDAVLFANLRNAASAVVESLKWKLDPVIQADLVANLYGKEMAIVVVIRMDPFQVLVEVIPTDPTLNVAPIQLFEFKSR